MSIGIGINLALQHGSAAAGAAPVEFLLRDDFPEDEAAPLESPRTADPGPGTGTITDTNEVLSISGGALIFATGGVTAGNPGVWYQQMARVAGRAMIAQATRSVNGVEVGWDNNTSGAISDGIRFLASGGIRADGTVILGEAYDTTTAYGWATILRSAGAFVLRRDGPAADWKLSWVGVASTGAMYPAISTIGTTAVVVVDFTRVTDLPAPWDSDFGIATDHLPGSVSGGTNFTHEADCLIEFTATSVSSAAGIHLPFSFRRLDEDNYWRLRFNPNGAIDLQEVVAGSIFTRGSVGEGTIANGHRIVVIADDEVIRVYSNNVLLITYSSAANFKTATGGRVLSISGGTYSDYVSWPRTLSGAAKSRLDAVVAA